MFNPSNCEVTLNGMEAAIHSPQRCLMDYSDIGYLYMLFLSNEKIKAIKYLRFRFSLGLREAKNLVEAVWLRMAPIPDPAMADD